MELGCNHQHWPIRRSARPPGSWKRSQKLSKFEFFRHKIIYAFPNLVIVSFRLHAMSANAALANAALANTTIADAVQKLEDADIVFNAALTAFFAKSGFPQYLQ